MVEIKDKEDWLVGEWTKIKAKGVFNLEDMYVELFYWFQHFGYEWKEAEYRHMNFPGGGYRLEVIWYGIKDLTDYHKTKIKLVLAADVKNVEVTLDGGKKVDRQKATFEFRTGVLLTRKRSIFSDRPFAQWQMQVYEILTKKRHEQMEIDAYSEAQKLYDELRAFMMLYKH
jgi:hypothetical protein